MMMMVMAIIIIARSKMIERIQTKAMRTGAYRPVRELSSLAPTRIKVLCQQ